MPIFKCDDIALYYEECGDFLFNVSREFVAACQTPLLVLLGTDLYHPESISREIASLAPNATLFEDWKEPQYHKPQRKPSRSFLRCIGSNDAAARGMRMRWMCQL